MAAIHWSNIRAIGGSQHEGFEEVVCQVARHETVPHGSVFRRVGKPDGGVECYWIMPDGSEKGWQAKYFLTSLTASQWSQLDSSVKTTLTTHPSMTTYVIAIPIDLADARTPNQTSAQQKWDERVLKWQKWANEQGREITFEFWGASQLLARLSQPQHRGRVWFWFEQHLFSPEWFTGQIEENIANAGARYTPELDIQLPVARYFDGLGRTAGFYRELKSHVAQLRDVRLNYGTIATVSPRTGEVLNELGEEVESVCRLIADIDEGSTEAIDTVQIVREIEQLVRKKQSCQATIEQEQQQVRERESDTETDQTSRTMRPDESFRFILSELAGLRHKLDDLADFLEGVEVQLANSSTMLLTGEAGKGKTHLFCDVARQRNKVNAPTILLLAEQFGRGNIWRQLAKSLDLANCSKQEILGALEAAGQAAQCKTLILIDAINESSDPIIWRQQLSGFLTVIRRYKWISIALSVRSTYLDLILPPELEDDQLVRVSHRGFAGVEYEATQHFFDHFNIERPSVPLLNPEFQTPLFLKLFCQGLANQRLKRMPKGLRGITAIFNFFLDSIYKRLQLPAKLNLSPHKNEVQLAIARFATRLTEKNQHWLSANEAEAVINAELPQPGYTNSLLYHLISEGVLSKDRFPDARGVIVEGISFAYQRLADHLIAKNLLERYLTENPTDAFLNDSPLQQLIERPNRWWSPQARGLIEALSIQLPERIGRELFDVVPNMDKEDQQIYRAFVGSLLWRDANAMTNKTREGINNALRFGELRNRFLNVLITLAVDPDHPYNAEFLHERLMRDSMAERDVWWSTFLFRQHGKRTAVDRIIDWAWAKNDKSHIDDEAIRLCAVTLIWFLTTSHRFVRDEATKALVNLLDSRLQIARKLLHQFANVNDPYIAERLYAVLYGCVLRSHDTQQIEMITNDVYELLFKNNRPPAHVLLRDYGRGIIEYAVHLGLSFNGDMQNVRPPYHSEWVDVPSDAEIESLKSSLVETKQWDGRIADSVTWDDFGRYIIGTNHGNDSSRWLSLTLNEPKWLSREDHQAAFVDMLTATQAAYWDKLLEARQAFLASNWRSRFEPNFIREIEAMWDGVELGSEEQVENERQITLELTALEQAVINLKHVFLNNLTPTQLAYYKEHVETALSGNNFGREEEPRFDLSKIQRWIIKRVFDLGWTVEKFSEFDSSYHVRSDDREAQKPERIGKKYQWIAYHEIIACISDNFQYYRTLTSHPHRNAYRGTWQLAVRDIDPSCVVRYEKHDPSSLGWWTPTTFDNWDNPTDHIAWLKTTDDLPSFETAIDLINPNDHSQWLNLHIFRKWKQPMSADINWRDVINREVWCYIQAYLIHKSDLEEMLDWAKAQNFMGRWMPEGRDFDDIYLGELYWSPAQRYYDDPFEGDVGWQIDDSFQRKDRPKPILPLSERYSASTGDFDCSVGEGYAITVPAKPLVEEMELRWSGADGQFVDSRGKLIASDPSFTENGERCLLIRKKAMTEFLKEHDYAIMWTLLGQKRLVGEPAYRENWQGETILNGVYYLDEDRIIGHLTSIFRSPKDRQPTA